MKYPGWFLAINLNGHKKMNKIGIIGGMGPEATLDLFRKIISNTPAGSDQDHLPILIDCNPQVPDRTQYLLNSGENPLPALLQSAAKLERSGAQALCMPCNTAHFFLEDIRRVIKIPFISMIESTCREITTSMPTIKKAGLFATTGTIKTKIYHKVFEREDIDLIVPDDISQREVMELIYRVKAGDIENHVEVFRTKTDELIDQGAEALIAGCTEIPLLLEHVQPSIPFFDPTLILAKEAILFSNYGKLNN